MRAPHGTQDEGLLRTIGPGVLGLSIVNCVVGSGIFVLPGLIALQLGSAAVVAYLVCSAAVALVFLCFAEIGSRVSRSGGAYAYIEEAFGPFAGFVASLLFWFGWGALGDAAVMVAMVDTISMALPILAAPLPRAAFIIAVFAMLAAVNVMGVRSGIRLIVFNTIAKLIPLLLLLLVGLFAINIEFLVITEWPTPANTGIAALILFFAFAGAESALSPSGEIVNPAKTVPRGLLLGLSGILVLYVGLQAVAQGVLGPELAHNTEAPLAAAAEAVFGSWGSKMLLAAAAISMFAALSGDMLNTPRVIFASARDGNLPAFLAKVHPQHKTPYRAVIFLAAVACAFALSGSFRLLAVVASGSILVIYLGVSLAVIRLRYRDGQPGAEEFRIPGGVTVPVLSCLVIGWFLLQMTRQEALGVAVLAGSAIAIFGIRRAIRRRGRGRSG